MQDMGCDMQVLFWESNGVKGECPFDASSGPHTRQPPSLDQWLSRILPKGPIHSPTPHPKPRAESHCAHRVSSGSQEVPDTRVLSRRARAQALATRIERSGLARGRIDRILHARVPILKFREATSGLECDVGICAGTALFKSAVLGLLAQVRSGLRMATTTTTQKKAQ